MRFGNWFVIIWERDYNLNDGKQMHLSQMALHFLTTIWDILGTWGQSNKMTFACAEIEYLKNCQKECSSMSEIYTKYEA